MKKICAVALSLIALLVSACSPTPAYAVINENLNNANWTYNGPYWLGFDLFGYPVENPQTASNQTNIILARGYGMCVKYGVRLDLLPDWAHNSEKIQMTAHALVQADNGSCTGPLVNVPITVETAPLMPITDTGPPQLRACTFSNTATAWVTLNRTSNVGQCHPSTEIRDGVPYEQSHNSMPGYWSTFTAVKVNGATFFHRPVDHLLIRSYPQSQVSGLILY